jgi:hypothetical protein
LKDFNTSVNSVQLADLERKQNEPTHNPTQEFKFFPHRTFSAKPCLLSFCKSKRAALIVLFFIWYAPHLLLPQRSIPHRKKQISTKTKIPPLGGSFTKLKIKN